MKWNGIGVLVLGLAAWPAAAQQPVEQALTPETLNRAIDRIIAEARNIRKAESEMVARLNEGKADQKYLAERVALSEKSLTLIHKTIDMLDANYELLSESQKETLRSSWDIAELFGAFLDNEKAANEKLADKEQQEEARVNAECAVRRAIMLEETVSQLKKK
jgi:hypothetical protein